VLGISPCCPVLGFPKNLELILVLILKVVFSLLLSPGLSPVLQFSKPMILALALFFKFKNLPSLF
jgi:hypothetical protein